MLRFLQTALILMATCHHATFGQLNVATFQNEALAQTNVRRAQHCTPPVAINSTLNTMAQTLANRMAQNNSFLFSGTPNLGENVWKISSTGAITYVNGSRPVESAYAGSPNYNYAAAVFVSAAGQFSQLVWSASSQIGVGIALTADSKNAYVAMNFFPRGNINGQFATNVLPPCASGTTPPPAPTTTPVPTTTIAPTVALMNFQNEALARHNSLRQKHCTPPVALNASLNTIAQNYANYLAANNLFQHSYYPGLGENLWYMGSSAALGPVNGALSAQAWYDEIKDYNYAAPGFSAATGHFTQVVWTDSVQLGVGLAYSADRTKAYAVANYFPPGNYQGQFGAKVKPVCL